MAYTLVSFHAHPDDEALLTGGTLARAAAEGHRVILVTATAGGAGLAASAVAGRGDLAELRLTELRRAATALGFDDVRLLGFEDSGMDGDRGSDGRAFARLGVETAAIPLADILRSVEADVLTIYDPAGGYGHPDHLQVHRVGLRAAVLAGTPVVLEATVDRRPLQRVLRVANWLHVGPVDWDRDRFAAAYSAPDRLTHRVDVRRFCEEKRAAMAAHASQATADRGDRSLGVFLRLPMWLFRRVFGYEWFVEVGRAPAGGLEGDIFATLRDRPPGHLNSHRIERP